MNDDERDEFIENDEGLYDWWRSSRQSKRTFIRQNRKELDEIINSIMHKEPQR